VRLAWKSRILTGADGARLRIRRECSKSRAIDAFAFKDGRLQHASIAMAGDNSLAGGKACKALSHGIGYRLIAIRK